MALGSMVQWPLVRVEIAGSSMEPTLRAGEWWLARRSAAPSVGDIVVLASPEQSGLVLVKRVTARTEQGWWVEGDNAEASRDSRHFGAVPTACIVGRLTVRYRPLLPLRVAGAGG